MTMQTQTKAHGEIDRRGPIPDYAAITAGQQKMWALGDFNVIARSIMGVADAVCEALDPRAGARVLDVACGSGNGALVAARRYCRVTGVDYVSALLERARQRAAAEGSEIDFREGDAQDLPFGDASFDAALSIFGVMFAPDQPRAARELLRVCRPGGRVALASWTPEGAVGDFFRAGARLVPPPPGLVPPVRWGTEAGLRELLGDRTRDLVIERRRVVEHFLSVEHAVDLFARYFGPTVSALSVLDPAGQRTLRDDTVAIFHRHNRAQDGTLMFDAEYLLAVATVR
jgi:SAM-dependent methyltransferase